MMTCRWDYGCIMILSVVRVGLKLRRRVGVGEKILAVTALWQPLGSLNGTQRCLRIPGDGHRSA